MYWNQGEDSRLLACECVCTSHDNTGWLVHGPDRQVQAVALGKSAIGAELADAVVVEDIMASHPFCETLDRRPLRVAEFVSLIKYPTGRDDAPYCFSVRTLSTSRGDLVIEDDGRRVDDQDDEVFLETPAGIADTVRAIVDRATAE
ncbi:hypothetical protein WQ56_03800 [Luteimonas sp. FCS-9]|nr:hypothetical protein WQ56_03800 [Luteimonas sp. FCS-9]